DVVRLGLHQVALRLQDVEAGGCAELITFVLGVEALKGELAAFDCRFHARLVLLYRELGVAHVDIDGVLLLLESQLRLAVFQLRAHLVSLGGPVADGDVQRDARTLVRTTRVEQITEGIAKAGVRGTAGTADRRIWMTCEAAAAVEAEDV